MAQENQLNLNIKKDIKVTNFSRGGHRPSSETLKHNATEPFFIAKVYPNGRNADQDGHVSVMVRRRWFYPRFIPGVVYGSLGWTVSVVDVEGQERFHAYFGQEDFLSLEWAEDLFRDHEFGVEKLVKRSLLLDSPDEFLPGDVLTVRCEAFYECRTGEAALATTGLEINAFLVKGFQTGSMVPSGHHSEEQSFDGVDIESQWRKSMRMMEESICELEGTFELYAKFQMLKDITDQNPKGGGGGSDTQQDRDFGQDIEMASAVFMSLRQDAENENGTPDSAGKEGSSDTVWYDEPDGVAKITHEVVRILALHKHLQLHFEKCKTWYKEAAEKMRAERDSCTGVSTRDYTLEDETRELFFLYNEIRDSFNRKEGIEQCYLLPRVSRFVAIFLNVLRLMALRLYWPICVLQASPPPTSSYTEIAKAVDSDTEPSETERDGDAAVAKVSTSTEIRGLSTIPETEKAGEELSEVGQSEGAVHEVSTNQKMRGLSTVPEIETEKADGEPSQIGQSARNKNADHKVSSNQKMHGLSRIPGTEKGVEGLSEVGQSAQNKSVASNIEAELNTLPGVCEESDPTNEKWYFTIETADGKRLDVPFQEGRTTLGSKIRAASPVFDRMLETPMLERAQSKVKLDDVDHDTLVRFATYVETGEVTAEALDDCRLLYMMAHKYQVADLLLHCGKRICELMSHLTAEEIGEFSKFFEDDTLMSMVDAYCFRPRATMAVMGLQDLNVSPLSPDSTWSQTIAQVPVVEKATEAIAPKQEYDFYN